MPRTDMTEVIESGLRRWRVDRGLSLEEVSALTGVSIAMLSRIERGERRPGAALKVVIARRLGVPLRTLFAPGPIPADAEEEG